MNFYAVKIIRDQGEEKAGIKRSSQNSTQKGVNFAVF